MKMRILYLLLALVPAEILMAEYDFSHLEGIWEDPYGYIRVEIKDHRKGLKMREINHSHKSKWRTYNFMGSGVYDDCDGNALIVGSGGELKWKRSFDRRPVYLVRYGYSHREDGYYDRDYGSYGRSYRPDKYVGDWFCDEFGLELQISLYGAGFRARNGNRDWVYYDRFGDNDYRDRHGNRYCFEEGNLVWCSSDGKRRFRFRKP